MEFVFVLAAIVVVAIVLFVLWQKRRLSRVEGLAVAWGRYIELRHQFVANPNVGSSQAFMNAADEIVGQLGPKFDPRTAGWERLRLLEPNLRAFVTQYADPATEEPLDLEAFAESILRLEAVQFRGITEDDWLQTVRLFATFASEWRMSQLGSRRVSLSPTSDEAMSEAVAVASRLFKFAEWSWDRKRNMAVDRMGRPGPGMRGGGPRSPVEFPAPSMAAAEPAQAAPAASAGPYGPNTAQVERLVTALSVLTKDEIEWLAASHGFLKDHQAVEPLPPDVVEARAVKAGFDRIVRLPLAAPDLPTMAAPMAIRAGANAVLAAIDNTGLEPPPNIRELAAGGGADLGLLVAARPEADARDYDRAWSYYTGQSPRLRTCLE